MKFDTFVGAVGGVVAGTIVTLLASMISAPHAPAKAEVGTMSTPDAKEFCYKGVTYVHFTSLSSHPWGTVRLDRESGNVIKCGVP